MLIVDDHALFRRGLEMVLEQEDDVEVVGEAGDGAEAIEKAQELMPDVVLMDVRMPRRSGIEATQTIKDLIPHAKILMLTISDEEADLYDAIKAGANGYLLKEISIEEVANAIRSVAQGQSLISPSMASKLLNEFATMVKRADEKQQVPTPRLTEREMEVLKLVAKGHNNRDIAKELYISENTVKNHIRNILEKLHLHSRMEAVVYAVREKLLEIRAPWRHRAKVGSRWTSCSRSTSAAPSWPPRWSTTPGGSSVVAGCHRRPAPTRNRCTRPCWPARPRRCGAPTSSRPTWTGSGWPPPGPWCGPRARSPAQHARLARRPGPRAWPRSSPPTGC